MMRDSSVCVCACTRALVCAHMYLRGNCCAILLIFGARLLVDVVGGVENCMGVPPLEGVTGTDGLQ